MFKEHTLITDQKIPRIHQLFVTRHQATRLMSGHFYPLSRKLDIANITTLASGRQVSGYETLLRGRQDESKGILSSRNLHSSFFFFLFCRCVRPKWLSAWTMSSYSGQKR